MGKPSSRKRSAQRPGKKERARVKNRRQKRPHGRMRILSSALRDCRNVDGAGHGFLKVGRKKSGEVNWFLNQPIAPVLPINDGESLNPESQGEAVNGRPTNPSVTQSGSRSVQS